MKRKPSRRRRRNKPRHNFILEGKTDGQKKYLDSIKNNIITICEGPAGVGKTHISTGAALFLYQNESIYNKIYIVRPALEACSERIGFLPGGISDKMRPLIQPIVDALRFFISDEGYLSSLLPDDTNNTPIEIRTMSWMRGSNFHNCLVIFDEAQNCTPAQMKLFLTRVGENCKVIVEGDLSQSDIMGENGLTTALSLLKNMDDVGIIRLKGRDVVRSKIVQKIIERYKILESCEKRR